MTDLLLAARVSASDIINTARERAAEAGHLPRSVPLRGAIVEPREESNGDLAANHALVSASSLGMQPEKLADILASHMERRGTPFSSAEAVGGFINFRFSDGWYLGVLRAVENERFDCDYPPVSELSGSPVEIRCLVLADAHARLLALTGGAGETVTFRPAPAPGDKSIVPVRGVRLLRVGSPAPEASISEVPESAVRWFLCSSPDAVAELDLDLAVRLDGGNPLYRVRYARERCLSLTAVPPCSESINGAVERSLIKQLAALPGEIKKAVETHDPGRIKRYSTDLAERFYRVYSARTAGLRLLAGPTAKVLAVCGEVLGTEKTVSALRTGLDMAPSQSRQAVTAPPQCGGALVPLN